MEILRVRVDVKAIITEPKLKILAVPAEQTKTRPHLRLIIISLALIVIKAPAAKIIKPAPSEM